MSKLTLFIAVLFSVYFFVSPLTCFAAEDTWDVMMDGIKRYSSDRKLRDQFVDLCSLNDTALIDGRIDTGGGLYMIMDVHVYREPGKAKRAELAHETIVIVTGATEELDGILWKEIEFLFISKHTNTAVSIDKAWVEAANLKGGS